MPTASARQSDNEIERRATSPRVRLEMRAWARRCRCPADRLAATDSDLGPRRRVEQDGAGRRENKSAHAAGAARTAPRPAARRRPEWDAVQCFLSRLPEGRPFRAQRKSAISSDQSGGLRGRRLGPELRVGADGADADAASDSEVRGPACRARQARRVRREHVGEELVEVGQHRAPPPMSPKRKKRERTAGWPPCSRPAGCAERAPPSRR